jgi:glycosyltransferase 2 family protein
LKKTIKLLAGLGLLGTLILKAGPGNVLDGVLAVGWETYAVAVVLYLFGQVVCASKWRVIAASLGIVEPGWKYQALYLSGMFMNVFLPTAIGGDVGKAYLLSGKDGFGTGIVSVLAERYFGFVVLTLILAAGLFLHEGFLPTPAAGTLKFLPLAVIVLPYLLLPWEKRIRRLLFPSRPEVSPSFSGLLRNGKLVTLSLVLSAIFYTVYIAMHVVVGKKLGIPATAGDFAIIVTLASLVSMIPVTIGGLGLREGSYMYLLSLQGVGSHAGIAFGIAILAVSLTLSLLGGIVLFVLRSAGKI